MGKLSSPIRMSDRVLQATIQTFESNLGNTPSMARSQPKLQPLLKSAPALPIGSKRESRNPAGPVYEALHHATCSITKRREGKQRCTQFLCGHAGGDRDCEDVDGFAGRWPEQMSTDDLVGVFVDDDFIAAMGLAYFF